MAARFVLRRAWNTKSNGVEVVVDIIRFSNQGTLGYTLNQLVLRDTVDGQLRLLRIKSA